MLSQRRIQRQSAKPLTHTEFIPHLARIEPLFKEEFEKFSVRRARARSTGALEAFVTQRTKALAKRAHSSPPSLPPSLSVCPSLPPSLLPSLPSSLFSTFPFTLPNNSSHNLTTLSHFAPTPSISLILSHKYCS